MDDDILERAFNITYRQMHGGCMCLKKLTVKHAVKCPLYKEIWFINYRTINNFIRNKIVRDGYTSEADFVEKVD